MALEIARAVQTPFPLPDMSSPSSSLVNRSFIISTSAVAKTKDHAETSKGENSPNAPSFLSHKRLYIVYLLLSIH